ncbi:MAG: glycosyltransferase family 88 protein [Candidatus Berkiella sp.]
MSKSGPVWKIETKRHYKIWFSANPDEFLNDENKLRFIRACLDNPDIRFSFVYSSAILSEFAIAELKDFCAKLNIQAVDFDSDVLRLLAHRLDKESYHHAMQEIRHAVKKQGGNLAAASDLIRWLPGLIQCCGIYSDFDVELKFQKLNPVINVKSPVILPTTLEFEDDALNAYTINNEFLAFAFDEDNTTQLSTDSIEIIRIVQKEMLKRYTQPTLAMLSPVIPGFQNPNTRNLPLKIILHSFSTNSADKSIFALRQFIHELDFRMLCKTLYHKVLPKILGENNIDDFADNDLCRLIGKYRKKQIETKYPDKIKGLKDEQIAMQFLEKLKNTLYKASVECISGPFVSMTVLKSRLQSFDFGDSIFSHPAQIQQLFIKTMSDSGLIDNELAECVFGQDFNAQQGHVLSDQSWTEVGGLNLHNRSEIIRHAAIVIQRAVRHSLKEKDISLTANRAVTIN